jgi:hypothetical protein
LQLLSLFFYSDDLAQSIPSVPYLEKEFGCHALHLPLGQSSVGIEFYTKWHSSDLLLPGSSSFTE